MVTARWRSLWSSSQALRLQLLHVTAIGVLLYIHSLESNRIWVTVRLTWLCSRCPWQQRHQPSHGRFPPPRELSAATASFAAVEVVFVGSVNSSTSCAA